MTPATLGQRLIATDTSGRHYMRPSQFCTRKDYAF